MVKVLERVLTKPIIEKSRERNIPMWLTLPILGCAAIGSILLFAPSSILNINTISTKSWPGLVYLIAAALYALAALLGYCISRFAILNTRDKHAKSFMVYLFIAVMLLTLSAVGKSVCGTC